MDDFANSCVRPDPDENKTRVPTSSEKPADVASSYAISSAVPKAAKNDEEEFKMIDQSHGEVLETSWKIISCGNPSGENASMEQEISQYQTCNRVMSKSDCSMGNDRCGMHDDLLFDILLWLPVASLLRFRSVSRLWRSFIDSSTFITQHYNHNSNKNCLLAHHVVSSSADYDSKFCLLSGNTFELYNNLDYEQPWYSVNEITILNSCNGIVSLLNKESKDVALWNPATKQLRPLPESSIFHQYLSLYQMVVEYGFGFDAKSNDYKFVRILYCIQYKHNNLVEVYSLRTDAWRTIHKDDVLPFQSIDCDVTTCKDGICFWTGYPHHDEFSPILISFDLNDEAFETMPLPSERDPDSSSRAYNALDPLNDKLCYIKGVNLGPGDVYHKYFEIWMLDEYGVEESWRKICKFGPTGSSEWKPPHSVLGFSKNGEFVLLGYRYKKYGELYLSNVDAREEEYAEFQNPEPLPSKYVCYNELQNPNPVLSEFVCYNESLVSLEREDASL